MAQVVGYAVVSAAVAAAPSASLTVFTTLIEYSLKATSVAIVRWLSLCVFKLISLLKVNSPFVRP